MKIISMIAALVVTTALVFYSLGFFHENRKKLVTRKVLLLYTLGVFFDITATIMMIIGSSQGLITPHGMIGYSSLLIMLTDTALLWRHNIRSGTDTEVSKALYTYSRIAFTWWVIAYITGGLLVAVSKMNG
jgi:uncharacterized repeat protein (TIGR03987 family)